MVHQKAEIAVKSTNDDLIRITRIAWLERNAETAALYARVQEVVKQTQQRDLPL